MASKRRWEDSLMESIIGWSEEFGVDYTAFFSQDVGFRFFDWWEEVVSCMSLDQVECYLNLPEIPGGREIHLVQRIREVAIVHRDRLLAAQKGAEEYAERECCAG